MKTILLLIALLGASTAHAGIFDNPNPSDLEYWYSPQLGTVCFHHVGSADLSCIAYNTYSPSVNFVPNAWTALPAGNNS